MNGPAPSPVAGPFRLIVIPLPIPGTARLVPIPCHETDHPGTSPANFSNSSSLLLVARTSELIAMNPGISPLLGLCASLIFAAAAQPATAQGSRADYQRAGALREMVQGKVFRDRVIPHWLEGGRFWYRVELPGGKQESWLVNARSGEKTPYTHPEAAIGGTLRPRVPEGVRSEGGSEETEILFENRTEATIRLFWVDGGGQRKEYGTVAPGASRRQHTFAGHAWLVTTEQGKALAAFVAEVSPGKAVVSGPVAAPPARPAREPGRSPDGRWQAFLKERNLWVREVTGGKEHQLTTDGNTERHLDGPLSWSPDSKKLVAFRTLPAQEHKVYLVESSPRDQLQPKLRTLDYLKPGDRIAVSKPCLFQVEDASEVPIADALFPNPWDINRVQWEPDSSRFSFLYNQRGHQVLRVVSVDAKTGASRPVIEEQSKTFIDYAGKLYLQHLEGTHEAIWMSERDGWNHLYLYDVETGRVKNRITHGSWVVRDVERVDSERRQVWFWAGGVVPEQDPYYRHLCRVNLDGSGFVDLTPGDGTHTVQRSPDGEWLLDTYSRVDLPPITELRRADDGKLVTELERGDASELLKTGWSYPERFMAPGRDGKTPIYGVIWRPTRFQPGQKYPVIENIYAGPQSAFVPKGFASYHGQRYLAELGFIVVQIDGMGTNWRSKAFHDVCWKNLADGGFPDRVAWLRAAAARYPELDLSRLGIYGGSAGGQNALAALLFHGDFYKAAVADCGCHDNRMDKVWWNELWMGWPVGPEYAANSNVTNAHRLQGKLLLVVGELDSNVDPASTMQVVNALVKADKDFDLLVVPGAGHGAAETPYGSRRRADFLVRHLLRVEPRHELAAEGIR